MKYTHLGRSGLVVSQLCLGTMNFGSHASEKDAHRIMDRALELGINFFDTANAYGRSIKFGFTEEIIGRWFAMGGDRRQKVVLATKLYASQSDWPNDGRLSARNIRQACDASLARLQTDHLDLYQMHHIDRETPFEEIWEAYEVLRQQGKVIYAGSSNFAGWHISQAQERAKRRNFTGLISEQSLYNLLTRDVELEVLPACRAYGLGLIPWSPLASGILGGALQKLSEGRRSEQHNRERVERLKPQLKAYEALCRDRGEHPALVALGWLLHQEGVAAPIIGPRTIEQLESAIEATQIKLKKRDLEQLDQIFPGPGGAAPEAYAW
ncbi:MAG TPA: aldo/keto reductase [Candidatus Dormibacteraeota bacterium]|nr:aldo/keto reductase [Candidatus Dormibacteraeota bacterium]